MLTIKIDTTRIEITGKQIDKIIGTLSQHPSGLSPVQAVLIAASIGAISAILVQVVTYLLTTKKERKNLRIGLIAEERRISHLLKEYYKELVMYKVHKQYWFRVSELEGKFDNNTDSYKMHIARNEKSFETKTKISVITSEYFKTVTHYTILTGQNKFITQLLFDIQSFDPRSCSEFPRIALTKLRQAAKREEADLNKEYLYYSLCFDKINLEMLKK
ncbi:hypothetical protein BDD43_0385 [Mucilaginibacter gracilis]|uniref:Uncharacterized protein n=1 Tax=Mucilaginibacter gracilis TaxID=423350 RepID=A0A495IWP2_9SPHI|nr:hypothetical protein [Mucilaginibacter gracilis]RKR80289.1 hypothetical protein BDD43_0385 [Mucilaginibacter gracilis]